MAGILVALGGNALHRAGGRGSWDEARGQMRQAVTVLAEIAAGGEALVLSHGNGPQVGALLRQNELAAREIPPRPMDVLGAETQGQIGYLIQTELTPALRRRGVDRSGADGHQPDGGVGQRPGVRPPVEAGGPVLPRG